MIKKLKQEGLRRLFFANTIALLVPAILVFCIIFAFTHRYPIIRQMTAHEIGQFEEIEQWRELSCLNVKMEISELKYTGYDYYDNGRKVGAYYYTFMEDQCVFVLVRTKKAEPVLSAVRIRGKLLEDSASLDAMKNEFTKELGLNYDDFNSFVYPYVISEVDYPYLEVFLLWLLIIIPYTMAISMIVFSVIWTIAPFRHPCAKQLSDFGDRKLVFQEVQSQVKNRLQHHNFNYYITDEYLIIHTLWTTDIIRIDYIRYISRHVILKMNGKQQVYRLTMSNPEKMFYERDFRSEQCANEIMEALIRLNPKIDNRTMHVFNLTETEEAEETAETRDMTEVVEAEETAETAVTEKK